MFIALSGVFNLRTITFFAPTIVSHHMYIPFTLITFFHNLQILVKSFSLLAANSTKKKRKADKMARQTMQFNTHVATKKNAYSF